jgi:hypothetical protein
MMRRDLEDLTLEVERFRYLIGSTAQYIKTGGVYDITSLHFREADMVLCAEYKRRGLPHIAFSRPVSEILDGRFAFIGGMVG